MVENNCLREELCVMERYRSAASLSGKSQFIFYIITRPKLLINDCVKINEGTTIDHSYFPFCAAGMPLFSHFKTLQC